MGDLVWMAIVVAIVYNLLVEPLMKDAHQRKLELVRAETCAEKEDTQLNSYVEPKSVPRSEQLDGTWLQK